MSRFKTGVDRRCPVCRLAQHLCLCDQLFPLPTRVRVLMLRHYKEVHKGSNSARLVDLVLPNCTIRDYGARDSSLELEGLAGPGVALLFPSDGGKTLPPAKVSTLVVVDGTWSQARRMMNRIPGLVTLPRLDVAMHATDRIRMRRSPVPGRVSTAEAVAYALDLLEGPGTGDSLMALYETQVERVWQARGRMDGVPWDQHMAEQQTIRQNRLKKD